MSELTLPDISKKMKDIDFVMFATRTEAGAIKARPMSNNGEVEYDGDSFFFTLDNHELVSDIQLDPNVGLSMQGQKGLLGKPPFFLAIEGRADLIRDKGKFKAHWTSGLDHWFEQGPDTPGLTLIKVHADNIHYWDGEAEGEIRP
jgi:general stress protein 26